MLVSSWSFRGRFRPVSTKSILAAWLTLGALAGGRCPAGEAAKESSSAPPPAVVVAPVIKKTVPIYSEFVARTDARDTVEIRARVKAFLEAQHFEEGKPVKKDQLLFTLDKREYEAQLLQAKAQMAKAEADLAFAKDNATVISARSNVEVAKARLGKAETDEKRLKPLAERRAVPLQDYDDAVANLDVARAELESRKATLMTAEVNQKSAVAQAEAAVGAARAAIVLAELNVGYCTINSPIDGLIGTRQVSPGNLVGMGEATLLDTVSSVDPIRVYLSVSDAEYLRLVAIRKQGKTRAGEEMELILSDGSVFPHKGKVVIADRAVDLRTGTLSIIAEFPNPEAVLRPGQFGRVRVATEVVEDAILVPRRAVQDMQGLKYVLVVGPDDVVAQKTIRSAEIVGDLIVVREGVKAGDRVIVDGVQKARPGTKVAPTAAGAGAAEAKPDEKGSAKPAEPKAAEAPPPAEPKAAGKAGE